MHLVIRSRAIAFVGCYGKSLIKQHSLEKTQTENLQNCVKTCIKSETVFDDDHPHIDRNRNPSLALHCIFQCTEERLGPQGLLYLLENQFHLPA